MRIRIKLNTINQSIPINYHSLIQGFIYHAIGRDKFSTELHNSGEKIEKRPFKLFTFSEIFGKTKYFKEKLYFYSNSYFEIAAFNDTIIERLIFFLEENDYISLGDNIFLINGYDIINDTFLVRDKMIFKTISPVVCNRTENKKVIYLIPNTQEYYESLLNNLAKKYYICFKNDMPKIDIKIDNIIQKKVYFRQVFYICYHYNITFHNLNNNLLQLILCAGIGSKNSMGFGMLRYEKKNISL